MNDMEEMWWLWQRHRFAVVPAVWGSLHPVPHPPHVFVKRLPKWPEPPVSCGYIQAMRAQRAA